MPRGLRLEGAMPREECAGLFPTAAGVNLSRSAQCPSLGIGSHTEVEQNGRRASRPGRRRLLIAAEERQPADDAESRGQRRGEDDRHAGAPGHGLTVARWPLAILDPMSGTTRSREIRARERPDPSSRTCALVTFESRGVELAPIPARCTCAP